MFESTYEKCLCHELEKRNLFFEVQKSLDINYKGLKIDNAYKMDLVVEDKVIVELKSKEIINEVDYKQLLTYLQLANKKVGLLINFKEILLRKGIKRLVL